MNRHANGSALRALLASALIVASLCRAAVVLAQASERQYDFDIAPLPLSQALLQFTNQTKLQLFYSPNDTEEDKLIAGEVKGRHTADEALAALLPMGFTFVWTNARTVTVLSPPANEPPGGVKEAAEAKDQQHSEMLKEQQLSMANGGGRSGSARGPYAFDWMMTVEGRKIPESVFGSLDPDIPVTVFDRRDIEALGVSSVTDLMRYVPLQLHTMPGSFLGDGTQFADLRGLGFDTTLVLINGRRTIATASALTVNAFDLNSIPPAAVERVEIVSDSNSAMYGADAIGGVVNIVLRKDVPEPRLDMDYGAADGGSVERHAAFSAAGSLGRASGSMVLDYFDRSPLLGRERDRWNDQDFTRFGSIDWRSPAAAPGNVSSTTIENLPGLSSGFAAIPPMRSGDALTTADFAATAGERNLESLFRYYGVTDAIARKGAVAQGEYKFAEQLSGFGELLYVDREFRAQFEPPALSRQLVSGENPHNPFHEDVLVDALLAELGPQIFASRAEMVRAAGGVRGRIREWDWAASLQTNRDDAVTVRSNELDQTKVSAALAASDSESALDPFGGAGANSPALLSSLLAAPSRNHFRTQANQSIASVRGPLKALPAGPLELAAGAEWREELARYDIGPPTDIAGSHQRSIVAAFGELRLPLVGEAAMVPAVHDLALVLSGRIDDYSDFGHAFNPEYALIWRPTSRLTVRTSLAQSFRPPSLFDLNMPLVERQGPIADPARNNELSFLTFRGGGNPDLQPSNADSLSIGLRFEPQVPSALRIGANYWRISIDDTVTIPSPERLLAAESRFPERVVRGPPSAADIAAGIPGPLQTIDVTRLNNGAIRTSGVDLSASVTLDTSVGRFKPGVSATWVHEFATSDLVSGPGVDRVGVANTQGTVPGWRGVATLSWDLGGVGLSTALRYVPSFHDVDLLGTRNGRQIGPQTVVDLQLSLDLGDLVGQESPWNGFEVRAGAFNLFNAEPPFAEVAGPVGFDASQADLRERFAYLKLAKKF
jgi:iron complex outermembrane recepter protein